MTARGAGKVTDEINGTRFKCAKSQTNIVNFPTPLGERDITQEEFIEILNVLFGDCSLKRMVFGCQHQDGAIEVLCSTDDAVITRGILATMQKAVDDLYIADEGGAHGLD